MSSTYSRLSIANSNFKQFFPFSEAGFFNFPSNSKIFFYIRESCFFFFLTKKKKKNDDDNNKKGRGGKMARRAISVVI